MCNRTPGCLRMFACLCGTERRACMPVWRILQLYACLRGRYGMCCNIWDRMQPRATLCGGLCDCMHACVADHAVPIWQVMPLHACLWGTSNLHSRF